MRSNPKLSCLLGAGLCAFVSLVLVHGVFESAARHAEKHLGGYTWFSELRMQLLTPSNFEREGHRPVVLTGPSEAREGLLPEVLGAAFPDADVVQHSLSMGTMEDVILWLQYVERVHGKDQLPGTLVLGLTPRLVANIHVGTPFFDAVDEYAPRFRVERSSPPRLLERAFLDSAQTWLHFRLHQTQRYQTAMRLIAHSLCETWLPNWSGRKTFKRKTGYSRYRGMPFVPREEIVSFLEEPNTFWSLTHAWNPEESRKATERDFETLFGIARRVNMRVVLVNLPEHPHNRKRFQKEHYSAYLRIIRNLVGDTPFIDLRDLASDHEFYDSCHLTPSGALRLSQRVVGFLKEQEDK